MPVEMNSNVDKAWYLRTDMLTLGEGNGGDTGFSITTSEGTHYGHPQK